MKVQKAPTLLIWALSLLLGSQWAAQTAVTLAENGQPQAVIALAQDTEAARFAAESLNQRLENILGAPLPVMALESAPTGKPALVLGQFDQPGIASLLGALTKELKPLNEAQRQDAFVVREVGDRILLAGGSDRAVLYALYDFLKRECGCGFFISGENLPSQPDLTVEVKDRVRWPRLPIRAFFSDNGTVVHYSAWTWSAQDWQRHVDWWVAQGLRQAWLPYGTPGQAKVWEQYGFAQEEVKPQDQKIAEPILQHVKQAGLEWIVYGWQGRVPEGFYEKYPEHQYVEVKWIDFPSHWYLRPEDPLFREILAKYIDNWAELYGHQGNIGMLSTGIYDEKVYGRDQEDRKALLRSFAQTVPAVLGQRQPQARLMLNSWAFHNQVFWTEEMLEAFFSAFPPEGRPLMFDFASNCRPFFLETNYFWGNDWVYGWYYEDAPCNFLASYPQGRIGEIRRLYEEGRLHGLVGTMEVTEYNEMIPNLICAAAWDPLLDFDEFLVDFVRSRYGDIAQEDMLRAWQALLQSAYGPQGDRRKREDNTAPYALAEPKYHYRLGARGIDWRGLHDERYVPRMNERLAIIPKLQGAIRWALHCRPQVEDNRFYQRDLVEWLRQVIWELFNQNFLRTEYAFLQGNSSDFAFYRQRTEHCLDLQIRLLDSARTWPEYSFAAQRGKAKQAPLGGRPWSDVIAWLAGSRGGDINVRHTDYYRVDRLESVRDYYSKRMRVYLEVLAQRLAVGERELPSPDKPATQEVMDWTVFNYAEPPGEGRLADIYHDIAYQFAYDSEPEPLPVEQLYTDNPVPTVGEIMKEISTSGLTQLTPVTEP